MIDQSPPQKPGSSGDPKADRAAAKAYAKAQRPLWKKKRVIIPAVFVVLVFLSATFSGGSGSDTANTANKGAGIKVGAPVATLPVATPPVASAPAKPAETSGQRNASRAAENYLSFSAFSRRGLIEQLTSAAGDGYSVADATYGVDAQHADYKDQAYKAAKNYLSTSAFSRQGLIEQLSSEAGDKYTLIEATYGADKALAK